MGPGSPPPFPLPPSLTPSPLLHRNEWEPPDKKVDTRKYRAEPRSIFEYEPGKSSVLRLERTVRGARSCPCVRLPSCTCVCVCVCACAEECVLSQRQTDAPACSGAATVFPSAGLSGRIGPAQTQNMDLVVFLSSAPS